MLYWEITIICPYSPTYQWNHSSPTVTKYVNFKTKNRGLFSEVFLFWFAYTVVRGHLRGVQVKIHTGVCILEKTTNDIHLHTIWFAVSTLFLTLTFFCTVRGSLLLMLCLTALKSGYDQCKSSSKEYKNKHRYWEVLESYYQNITKWFRVAVAKTFTVCSNKLLSHLILECQHVSKMCWQIH